VRHRTTARDRKIPSIERYVTEEEGSSATAATPSYFRFSVAILRTPPMKELSPVVGPRLPSPVYREGEGTTNSRCRSRMWWLNTVVPPVGTSSVRLRLFRLIESASMVEESNIDLSCSTWPNCHLQLMEIQQRQGPHRDNLDCIQANHSNAIGITLARSLLVIVGFD
ncbi:hypothetical protein PIB30_038158, partial [Stylosanthes scabra]|nr:hypothetical protein [Stylosanthes scabra]